MGFAAYLLDIEGTTTPIDFVRRTLFPYARKRLAAYVAAHPSPDDLEAERQAEGFAGDSLSYLNWLMDQDRKSPALKRIQGEIWEEGYRSGVLKGEVYPDVVPAIRRWREAGARVYIYSSGSVLAQKLLFGFSTEGDLTPLLDGYFDTGIGPKREAESYRKIISEIPPLQVPFGEGVRGGGPEDILFLSDIEPEVAAAREAGMGAALVVRGAGQSDWPRMVCDFTEIP